MKASRPFIEISLDRVRKLQFTFNAYCDLENAIGASLEQIGNPLNLGLRGQRAMLFAGLREDDPSVTIERAGEFFDEFDRGMILQKIAAAIEAANGNASGSVQDPNVRKPEISVGQSLSSAPAASE